MWNTWFPQIVAFLVGFLVAVIFIDEKFKVKFNKIVRGQKTKLSPEEKATIEKVSKKIEPLLADHKFLKADILDNLSKK
jgi:hypothetical protein